MKRTRAALLALSILFIILAGCGSQPSPSEDQTSTPPPASAPAGDADAQKTLKVAFVVADTVESIYNRTMLLSLQHLQDAGETFEVKYIENTTADTAEPVLRTYAEAGYDIIIAHAGICRDAVPKVYQDYPNVVFLGSGNDWETPAPNVGAYDQALHEGCYVQGVVAGLMTKSNVVGFVGGMPTGNVTSEVNAFQRGVASVNPDCEVVVSYIESRK